jgi:hypothetical protein
MKDEFNKYGRRLTDSEFTGAVCAIKPRSIDGSEKSAQQDYREQETNLMIDHLLGVDYPQDRRDTIHRAREQATKKFLSPLFIAKALAINVGISLGLIKSAPPFNVDVAMEVITKEFSKEKSIPTEDIIQFLGEETRASIEKFRPKEP